MTPDFIHEFVPGSSNRTLLLLHGTGGNEHDLIPLGRELDPNAALLSPRGKVLENGMPRFFRRLAEGVFDLEDLQKRTHELADFVAAAADRYDIGNKNIVAVGYSNGANIAASTLLLRPEILAGAILFRAMIPLEPEERPDLGNAAARRSPESCWCGCHRPISQRRTCVNVCRHFAGPRLAAQTVSYAAIPLLVASAKWKRDHFDRNWLSRIFRRERI